MIDSATVAPTRPTCSACLPDRYRIRASGVGFESIPCGQSVGVRTYGTSTGERVGYCSRDGHEANVRRRFPTAAATPRSAKVEGCLTCTLEGAPPHVASPRCESGKRSHCSCSACF